MGMACTPHQPAFVAPSPGPFGLLSCQRVAGIQMMSNDASPVRSSLPVLRRGLLPAVLSLAVAASAATSAGAAGGGEPKCDAGDRLCRLEGYSGSDPSVLVTRGMELFKAGRVEESVRDFDRAMEIEPRYGDILWQRGLSLYYMDEFDKASEQFIRDVRLNPRDSEEAIWNLLSLARKPGADFAKLQSDIISILPDSRPYMKAAYGVFAGSLPISELEKFTDGGSNPGAPAKGGLGGLFGGGGRGKKSLRDAFYADLYLGLLAEAVGDAEKAKTRISAAAKSDYGDQSNDYMWHLAKVHCSRRGWQI